MCDMPRAEAIHFEMFRAVKSDIDRRVFSIARCSRYADSGSADDLTAAIETGERWWEGAYHLQELYAMLKIAVGNSNDICKYMSKQPQRLSSIVHVPNASHTSFSRVLSDMYQNFVLRFPEKGARSIAVPPIAVSEGGSHTPHASTVIAMFYAAVRRIWVVIAGIPIIPLVDSSTHIPGVSLMESRFMPAVWFFYASQLLTWWGDSNDVPAPLDTAVTLAWFPCKEGPQYLLFDAGHAYWQDQPTNNWTNEQFDIYQKHFGMEWEYDGRVWRVGSSLADFPPAHSRKFVEMAGEAGFLQYHGRIEGRYPRFLSLCARTARLLVLRDPISAEWTSQDAGFDDLDPNDAANWSSEFHFRTRYSDWKATDGTYAPIEVLSSTSTVDKGVFVIGKGVVSGDTNHDDFMRWSIDGVALPDYFTDRMMWSHV